MTLVDLLDKLLKDPNIDRQKLLEYWANLIQDANDDDVDVLEAHAYKYWQRKPTPTDHFEITAAQAIKNIIATMSKLRKERPEGVVDVTLTVTDEFDDKWTHTAELLEREDGTWTIEEVQTSRVF